MNKRVSIRKTKEKHWIWFARLEVNIPHGIHHPPLWASSSKRKGYGLQILVKMLLGGELQFADKKANLFVCKT